MLRILQIIGSLGYAGVEAVVMNYLGRLTVKRLSEDNKACVKALAETDGSYSRKDARQKVIDGGYDISHEAVKLQKFYLANG